MPADTEPPEPVEPLLGALGTRLRALLDAMDGDVGRVLADLGLKDYRPRFSAVVRVVAAHGPSSIRDIATALGVTHSAASQTVGEMSRRGLVELVPGADARRRLVHLTAQVRQLQPAIDAEWEATAAAARELGAELSVPLDTVVAELAAALDRRSFHDRVTDHLERRG